MSDYSVDSVRTMPVEGPVPSAPPGWTWDGLMGRALACAEDAERRGEVPVGAVVVGSDGSIVGESGNAPVGMTDPTAHAEVLALRAAARRLGNYRLDGCVLVVTLEPCTMCAGAMVHARIDGVVFGALDPIAGAVLSRADVLDYPFLNHTVWHMGGVRSAECADQLRRFFARRRTAPGA